jgi:hypothetical protein
MLECTCSQDVRSISQEPFSTPFVYMVNHHISGMDLKFSTASDFGLVFFLLDWPRECHQTSF